MDLNTSTKTEIKKYDDITNEELIAAHGMVKKEFAKYHNLQMAKKVQL